MKKNKIPVAEILYFLTVTILYIAMVVSLLFYATHLREASNTKTKTIAERVLVDFALGFLRDSHDSIDWLSKQTEGIAIFSGDDEILRSYGIIPESLEDYPLVNGEYLIFDKEGRFVEYVRAIPRFDIGQTKFFSQDESPPFTFPRPDVNEYGYQDFNRFIDKARDEWIFLYIKIKDPWYSRDNYSRTNLFLILILVPLTMGLLLLGSSILFHRYMKSQNQLATQKNLVLLGTAVRTISHEMKNPLGAIYLQVPLIDKLTDGKVKRETSIINSEVERMTALISWISDFLKEPVGVAQELNLNRETQECRERFSSEIQWEIPQDEIKAVIDTERFRTIIDNLINNALESGSETDKIHVTLEASSNRAIIKVSDRGSGISTENQKKIFDPFFTSKSRGSGVGLAVVKRFIEAAGGKISLNSEVDLGTEITIELKRIK